MKQGSVIVDLASEQGGNCEVTRPGESYEYKGVRIIGYTDLPSRMASQSSQLYGTNLWHLLSDMGGSDNFKIDLEDEVVRGALQVHEGEILPPPEKPALVSVHTSVTPKSKAAVAETKPASGFRNFGSVLLVIVGVLALTGIGVSAPSNFISHFTVFVLACFVGWQVIWNVTPALHTPLMSVTNAISGIIIVGGMLQISGGTNLSATTILGAIAILIGTINISGGFLVTQRMLKMFQK
jgi:NAD(P) transhydrogenase subunit alpha